MERTLKLIPLKNILRTDAKYKEIVAAILEQLKDFTDSKYKSNPELVLHIITIIENTVGKKDRIDKLQLACDVFSQLFGITDKKDVDAFINVVEFLLNNKQVKKIAASKYVGEFLKKFFLV